VIPKGKGKEETLMVDKRQGPQDGDGAPSGLARYLSRTEARFDLSEEIEKIRRTATWRDSGHNAKELVKYSDLRIALILLKAWKRIEGHKADARISIQTISGRLKLHLSDETVQLGPGQVLTLERGVKHDVEAEEESAFLLTICWPAKERPEAAETETAETEAARTLEFSTVENAARLVDYQPGSVVSRQLIKKPTGNVTLFSFDQGQGLAEHTSPFDALVQVVEGAAEVVVMGQPHQLSAGEMILMPAGKPHALKAVQRFKMMLTMIRS
jgi:quercetin dioxygenase-like cupin family protein